jgi:2-oxoglutarate/2-oxoacid ferredoxin oxidoreductase subunit beta
MAIARKTPALLTKQMSFCPGCGHGLALRLIAECLEELGQDKNVMFSIGVGCIALVGEGLQADQFNALHGRSGAVATAMKRLNPETLVISYQGDGDAYSIGIAETMNAAYRNENITVIAVNNTNYGMTGGQMSTTTMPGQKTTTTKHGRDCGVTGIPLKFPELVASQFPNAAFVARGTITTPANVNKMKGYIKNALEAQMNHEGYSIVEMLSPCPTNWGITPLESHERIEKELIPYYPLGELKKRRAK